jgi:two-component system chemotaxis response regulator CheB
MAISKPGHGSLNRRLPEASVEVPGPSAVDIVAIAGSLGGPEAIRELVGGLPKWFPAALLVVQHRTPAAQLITVNLLQRSTGLEVRLAAEDDAPCPGLVHVTPADRDLVIGPSGTFVGSTMQGPRLPADALFTSVAARFGPRVIGVILSGTNADAAQGAVAIKRAGGHVVAQNRATARCFEMPAAAIATGCVDLEAAGYIRYSRGVMTIVDRPGLEERTCECYLGRHHGVGSTAGH